MTNETQQDAVLILHFYSVKVWYFPSRANPFRAVLTTARLFHENSISFSKHKGNLCKTVLLVRVQMKENIQHFVYIRQGILQD